MRLFYPEHRKAVEVFYQKEHESYAGLLESLSAVLEKDVAPNSVRFDSDSGGIAAARRVLFEQGICRLPFDSQGGLSLPFGVYSLAMELTGAADAPTAMSLAIHNTVADGIFRFGNEAQRTEVFEDLISGRKLASFSLTEPSSGSDARSMHTTATRRGSGYVIDGTKTFITNAGEADAYFVVARTEKGHAAFMVDGSTAGLTVGSDIPKLGMRGSRTAEVRLEGCEVTVDSLVGEDGRAFEYVKAMLNGSRIIMGSICVGIALTAYRKALAYGKERRLFDQKLSDMQITREKVANMRADISSSRLMCLYASRLKESGLDHASEAAQAKVIATEMATRVCDQVIQLFGGYGYTNSDIHRHWRDARLLTIGEGASEVLRLLIAGKELAGSA
ncbi:MAG: acyl-CoA dehydrogenase family protein [Thaumarchaeota archaeon]|nr:acyl-CoA dehydrogenase family protein [Nitrososphaerota archaeon]